MANKVTKEQIKHIAHLAKLELSEEEVVKFENEFNNILDYVSQIQECDTSDIEFEHNMDDFKGDVLQEDKVMPSLSIKKVELNATKGRYKNRYIKTSKIVNKEE